MRRSRKAQAAPAASPSPWVVLHDEITYGPFQDVRVAVGWSLSAFTLAQCHNDRRPYVRPQKETDQLVDPPARVG